MIEQRSLGAAVTASNDALREHDAVGILSILFNPLYGMGN